MKFGLADDDLNWIIQRISSFTEIDKVILFGSRAKENYKRGSDIDIAIYGQKIDFHVVSHLQALLQEQSHMPYMVDVVDGTHLTHEALREHIDRVGQVIYVRSIQ